MAIIANELTPPAINKAVARRRRSPSRTSATTEGRGEDKKRPSSHIRSTRACHAEGRAGGSRRWPRRALTWSSSAAATARAPSASRRRVPGARLHRHRPARALRHRRRPARPVRHVRGRRRTPSPSTTSAVDFDVDQAAYLAGVIAAAASRDDTLGIISGTADCAECNRYIEGFTLGAQSGQAGDRGAARPTSPTRARRSPSAIRRRPRPSPRPSSTSTSRTSSCRWPAADRAASSRPPARPASSRSGPTYDVSANHPELAECILTSVTKDYRVRGPRADLRLRQGRRCARVAAGPGRRPRGRDRRVDPTGRACRWTSASATRRPSRPSSRARSRPARRLRGARPASACPGCDPRAAPSRPGRLRRVPSPRQADAGSPRRRL